MWVDLLTGAKREFPNKSQLKRPSNAENICKLFIFPQPTDFMIGSNHDDGDAITIITQKIANYK